MQVTGLAMKVQQLVLSFWLADAAEQSSPSISSSSFSSSSLIMNLNRLSPLTSCKLASPPSATPMAPCSKIIPPLDLRILNSPGTNKCTARKPGANCLVETAPSDATRWIPMPEQIKVLEALYRSGMRSPKARQIEDITTELRKYGRIEGKNVFYWFQNHKARERQKQKRSALLALTMNSSTQSNSLLDLKLLQQEEGEHEMKEKKRRCRSWCGLQLELQLQQSGSSGRDQTLELFPLHPERKQDGIA